jgi:hypothetical protein
MGSFYDKGAPFGDVDYPTYDHILCHFGSVETFGWTFGLLAHQLQVDKKTLTGQINRSLKSTAAYFREKYVYLPRSYEAVMDNVWVLLCFAAASSRRYLQITPHCSFLLYCRFQSL